MELINLIIKELDEANFKHLDSNMLNNVIKVYDVTVLDSKRGYPHICNIEYDNEDNSVRFSRNTKYTGNKKNIKEIQKIITRCKRILKLEGEAYEANRKNLSV